MKLPEKLDRIAKMEIKAPSFKRSGSKPEPAPTDEHRATPEASGENGGSSRFSAFKRPGKPSLRRRGAAAGGAGAAAGAAKASGRGEGAASQSPKLPGPVNDLYRDLRDRHLLIPVVLLLVALVAVPLLLSRSAEPAPAVPPAPDLASADAIAPAVVVEDVGVRDYRKRLDALKRTNPFEAPNLNLDAATADGSSTDSTTDPGGTDLPPTDPGTSLPTSDPGTGLPTDPGVTDPGTVPPTDDGGDTGDSGEEPEPADPIIRYIDQVVTHEVDVKAGVAGNGPLVKQFKNLGSLQPVPSETNPVVAYMGTDETGTKAAFLLSQFSLITKNEGGDCYPSPQDCQVVFLEQGEEIRVDFQKENQQVATPYRVNVTRIAEKRTRVRD